MLFNLWGPAPFSKGDVVCRQTSEIVEECIDQLDFPDAKSLHQTGHLDLHQLCCVSHQQRPRDHP